MHTEGGARPPILVCFLVVGLLQLAARHRGGGAALGIELACHFTGSKKYFCASNHPEGPPSRSDPKHAVCDECGLPWASGRKRQKRAQPFKPPKGSPNIKVFCIRLLSPCATLGAAPAARCFPLLPRVQHGLAGCFPSCQPGLQRGPGPLAGYTCQGCSHSSSSSLRTSCSNHHESTSSSMQYACLELLH
jgi:hypothetical protein